MMPSGYSYIYALRHCEDYDSYLVEITSEEENNFVKDFVRQETYDSETGVYIGARKRFMTDAWQWQKSGDDLTFTDWSQPGKRRVGRESVCASLNRDQEWAWVEQSCDISQGQTSVCETCPLQKACFQGSCYQLMCSTVDQNDIEDKCRNIGGYVLEINSQEESDFIKGFLNKYPVPQSDIADTKNVWVGLSDEDEEGNFKWLSNGAAPSYTNWMNDEPNNLGVNGRDENCVVLDGNNEWKWNDVMCFFPNALVCESADANGITG